MECTPFEQAVIHSAPAAAGATAPALTGGRFLAIESLSGTHGAFRASAPGLCVDLMTLSYPWVFREDQAIPRDRYRGYLANRTPQ